MLLFEIICKLLLFYCLFCLFGLLKMEIFGGLCFKWIGMLVVWFDCGIWIWLFWFFGCEGFYFICVGKLFWIVFRVVEGDFKILWFVCMRIGDCFWLCIWLLGDVLCIVGGWDVGFWRGCGCLMGILGEILWVDLFFCVYVCVVFELICCFWEKVRFLGLVCFDGIL